jgi:eukaryotic-like serine/threonine-protein kinase
MGNLDCLTATDLRAFQLGEVPDRVAALISGHLDTCPACAALAEQLDTVVDPCIVRLRGAVGQAVKSASASSPSATASGTGSSQVSAASAAGFPRFFGEYEVLGELGRGGMSVVYLARQKHPARTVALKLILAGAHAGAERRARLLAEADATGRLQHPNIVQIYEVGERDDQLFLSLEYVDGGSLARQLDGKPQDPAASAALVQKMARAVQYAHERGVIHRDLKPANILLHNIGSDHKSLTAAPKIADFGLAKQDEVNLTATNATLGTPSYMAPEQATGDNRLVGPAVDIYALGAILYEMLTGQPPFRGATALETLEQARSWEPVPVRQRQPKVPLDLDTICRKCLHKEPSRRFGTALELAEDLGRFLAGEPIRARPVGALDRAWRWGKRNPAWATALVGMAVLLLVIAVGSSLLSVSLNAALTSSDEEKVRAQQAQQQVTEQLWEAYLAQARASRLSGRIGQHFQSLATIRKALQLPTPKGHSLAELRTEAIASLVLPDLEFATESGPVSSGVPSDVYIWEPDLKLECSVRADKDGNASLRRLKDDSEFAYLLNNGPLLWCGLSFSPDGRFVQQRARRGQKLWDLAGPVPVAKVDIPAAQHVHNVAFSSDSQRVAFVAAKDCSIVVYATESGQPLQTIQTGFLPERLAFHPLRNELAVSGNNIVRVFDVATGAQLAELTHPKLVYSLAWHPEGHILATGCDDFKIRLWNAENGTLARQPLSGHQVEGILLRFSHGGDYLVSSDWSGLPRLWDTRTGRQVLFLPGVYSYFSADDRQLVVRFTGDRLRILPFTSGSGLVSLALPFPDAGNRFGPVHAGPDDRFFFATSTDVTLLIDWGRGHELGQIPLAKTRVLGPEGDKAFLTSGSQGLLRWPVQANGPTGGLRIGPPETLAAIENLDLHGASADGRVLAIPQYGEGALLWHRPDRRLTLGPREDVRFCAVSPDGRWVATGNHNNGLTGIGATVWDARMGRAAKDFHTGGICLVAFSPDNRWLLTRGGGFRLWKVGTWEEGSTLHDEAGLGGWFAFSPDGKTLALTGSMGQVRLVETDTGREIARLTVPEQTNVRPYCFSRDGTKLAATGSESQLLYLWDLRVLRAGLKELGLDWDQPAYPPAGPPASGRLQVEVDLGLQR